MDKITAFINELIMYDYILFGSLLLIFILLIFLGIIMRRKTAIAVLIILLAFITLVVGSTFGYITMHQFLFKNTTSIISQKKLTYTKAIVVYGEIKNLSKNNFKNCKITAKVYKVSGNEIKDYLLKFKPITKMSIIEYDIPKGQQRDIKFIIEPFTYSKDYNISLGASCR